jgi:hypothetical protein
VFIIKPFPSIPRSVRFSQPKANSEKQKKKREDFIKNLPQFICCEKCKKRGITLYSVKDETDNKKVKYYCFECNPLGE